jgi:hypothetical protein
MEKCTIFQEMLKGVCGLVRYEWPFITSNYLRKSLNAGKFLINKNNIKTKYLKKNSKIDKNIFSTPNKASKILKNKKIFKLHKNSLYKIFIKKNGKIHFGYIYGFGVMGTIVLYSIMNLLSQSKTIELYNTMSILGYCLLPVVILAFLAVFINLT